MFSGNRVEVLNQQPDRLAAQLGKNMPFVQENARRLLKLGKQVRVVDMKNMLGGQFYFFQARRGGPTRVRPATHPKP